MKTSISDGELTLIAENESDQSLLMELWQHPLIAEIELPHFEFMKKDCYGKMVCIEPKRKEKHDN